MSILLSFLKIWLLIGLITAAILEVPTIILWVSTHKYSRSLSLIPGGYRVILDIRKNPKNLVKAILLELGIFLPVSICIGPLRILDIVCVIYAMAHHKEIELDEDFEHFIDEAIKD